MLMCVAVVLGSEAATAIDNCDLNLSWSQHNVADIGQYDITVNATDASGNSGTLIA